MTFEGLVRTEPDSCPICGAEAGRCVHEGRQKGRLAFEEWADDYEPREERKMAEGDVVATERIWEDLPIPKSSRKRRVLRFRPGQVIPKDRAEALNVGPDGRQGSVTVADRDETGWLPLNQGPEPEIETPPVALEATEPVLETPGGPDLETKAE